MGKKKSAYTLSKYSNNRENPFLEEAIGQIEKKLVKKYKNSSGTNRKAILQAINSDGELVGHTSFIRQIEVDEEQFTKVYLSQFSVFWELKSQAIRVFGYIMTRLKPKQDMFIFLIDECLEHTGYKSKNSVWIGLGSLLEKKIIARGPAESLFFINPMIAFNGDRVSFTRTYIRKRKEDIKEKDPNQMNMLEEINKMEEKALQEEKKILKNNGK